MFYTYLFLCFVSYERRSDLKICVRVDLFKSIQRPAVWSEHKLQNYKPFNGGVRRHSAGSFTELTFIDGNYLVGDVCLKKKICCCGRQPNARHGPKLVFNSAVLFRIPINYYLFVVFLLMREPEKVPVAFMAHNTIHHCDPGDLFCD